MCGRYTLATPVDDLQRRFGFAERPNLAPSYNIAPTQAAPVIRRWAAAGGRELAILRWGLVPAWSEGPDGRFSMINARAETVATKPAYRAAFRQRRCLVPADGFYEWQKRDGRKQPYFIRLRSGEPMAFAGLWERWTSHTGQDAIESFTIVVTDANELVRPIHDRMPVILAPEDYDRWLDPGVPDGRALLRPCPPAWLEAYPVGTRVNSPGTNDARLLEPLASRA
ncbi:MAG TPA: SOS response-associated peptidase [Geminicoccaceae bacterium]|nr:SOS response-associated peptidase [Geminicoccaceae bacterium]